LGTSVEELIVITYLWGYAFDQKGAFQEGLSRITYVRMQDMHEKEETGSSNEPGTRQGCPYISGRWYRLGL
jgi:hypothetical protein